MHENHNPRKMSDSTLIKTIGDILGSCGNRRTNGGDRLSAKTRTMKSAVPEVIKKLKRHSEYADITLESQLRGEAEELISVDSIMERFFSTITYNLVDERIMEHERDQKSELESTYAKRVKTIQSINRVEDVAKFQVKLVLRYVNRHTTPPRLIGKLASALQMEYGPLHASLLINDEILLEWNASSLITPIFINASTCINARPMLVAATVPDHMQMHCQLSRPYETYDEVELILDAASKKMELLHKLARVIARYNSVYYYDVIFRNCQNFVLDALSAIGCQNKPQFGGKLQEYFTHLKKEGRVKADFESHTQLDSYVRENQSKLTQENMEYLLAQYFTFHMQNVIKSGNLEDWNCKDGDCMMDYLEVKVDEKLLIMHRYLHQQNELENDKL